MLEFLIVPLFHWMPLPVWMIARGVAALFFFTLVMHVIQFIIGLLPWR